MTLTCGAPSGFMVLRCAIGPDSIRSRSSWGRALIVMRLPGESRFESRLHDRPVLVDHCVPRGVAPLSPAHEHVPAKHSLERRRQARQRGTCPSVRRVRLELDAREALLLERVLQQEILRLRVRARPPSRRRQPRVPDLDHAVALVHVEVAGVPDEAAIEEMAKTEVDRLEPLPEELAALV